MICVLVGALAAPVAFGQAQPDSCEAARAKVTQMRNTVKREERELGFTDEKRIRLDGQVGATHQRLGREGDRGQGLGRHR